MSERNPARSDVLTGGLIAAAGLCAGGRALFMPKPADVDPWVAYLTYPGSLPLLLGAVLFLGGLTVCLKGFRRGGALTPEDLRQRLIALNTPASRRVLIFVLSFLVYTIFLLGSLPFWLATFLYLLAAVATFRPAKWSIIVLITIGVSVSLQVLFEQILKLPLP